MYVRLVVVYAITSSYHFTKFFPHNHSKEQLHNIIRNWIALHNDNLKTIAKLRYQLRKDTFDSISNQLIISDQPEMKANFRIHSISALVVVLSTIGLELSTHIHALVVPSSLHRSCQIQLKYQNIFKGQKPQHHDTSSSYLFSVGSADIDIDHDVNNKSIQDERDQENQSLNKISISKNFEMEAPSIKRIISFAIPAIGVYLCNPLLSTIDTSTVGLFCGTLQQAALNPAVTIIDYSARLFSFLYTGTTNLVASSNKEDETGEGLSGLKDTFVGALQLSLIVGTFFGIILLATSQNMLIALIGNESIDPELLKAAWRYIAIRAIGFPAAAMIGTSQAACLGLQDNRTPFQIIVTAALLNLILDIILVGRKWAWVGGTAGAAWATTISQYVGLALFLRKFTSNRESRENDKFEKSNDDSSINRSFKPDRLTKGLLAGRMKFKSPPQSATDNFRPYFIPVTTTQIGRCSMYIAMGHVVSSTFDAVNMAAQQIITTLFYTLVPIGDSCGLTAQSFLPSIMAQKPSEKRTERVNKTIRNIYGVAGILGIFLWMIVACIPLFSPLLTTDPTVMALVQTVVPVLGLLFFTHGFFCAAEGILLALRDLKFLGRSYTLFFAIVPFLILRLKYAARAGANIGLASVWNVFAVYQAVRISVFTIRAFLLRSRLQQDGMKDVKKL